MVKILESLRKLNEKSKTRKLEADKIAAGIKMNYEAAKKAVQEEESEEE